MGVGLDSAKDELFKRSRTKHGFFSPKAKEVISNITKLKDFLLLHRKDYINAGSLISSDLTRMTDNERDQIDQDAQIFMRTCSEAIRQLRSEAEKQVLSAQMKEHRAAVLDLVEMSRLEPENQGRGGKLARTEPAEERTAAATAVKEDTSERDLSEVLDRWREPLGGEPCGGRALSRGDADGFEQENQRLVSEMSSLVDEAIKNNAGFRVWILFFLVMCSFSLLFLDWYDG
ncbi:hypothetical protein CRUP_020002 [Coryphaenoides rupestris]|nr:hypothetical protein CRUP_020002 [Coryphaenoides rupestris]